MTTESNNLKPLRVISAGDLEPEYLEMGISSHELVGREMGAGLAAGLTFYRDCNHKWTVWYDEVLICFSVAGRFELEIDGRVQRMRPGDMIFLPKGTSLIYRAVGTAAVFYGVVPVTWADELEAQMTNLV